MTPKQLSIQHYGEYFCKDLFRNNPLHMNLDIIKDGENDRVLW
jgi:hypothetical protein